MKITPRDEALFDAARNLPDAAARKAFLDQACSGDAGLRGRIEALLEADMVAEQLFAEAAPGFKLTSSPKDSSPANFRPGALAETIGSQIGPYKLLQQIGEGGGGVVYMVGQEAPVRRKVALKIIKLGMDTKSVIARFDAERHALAMMDHPSIARVLDAGATQTGRPYFVMELVRGIKITDYCDKNNLDTRNRLELFVQVCRAVQHAHQKGVIHRDIKPSNILITLHDGVAVPKVIDFGIAKAIEGRLTEQTLFTAYEQIIGTPAYMSPEQAEMSGLDVDTRSDIYSLGVLLYELLTGRTPFDPKELVHAGLDEMRRTLREKEPQRPSTILTTLHGTELESTAQHRREEPPKLISLLKGDLDWIVMKALEKDRKRRYETANGLAMDIERYLHNEPVIARPPSRFYRFQKLVRRNKIIFAAGAVVALTLLAGIATTTWLLVREREARRRAVEAERAQDRLRRAAEMREKISHATVLIHEGNFGEAERLVTDIQFDKPSVEAAAVLRALGEWSALNNRWPQAARHFTALLGINELDGSDVGTLDYLECGPALIESGDMAGYERFRQAAVERFQSGENSFSDRILKIALLLPPDERLLNQMKPVAGMTAQSLAPDAADETDVFLAAWRSVSVALMEYRSGRDANAAAWCERCLNYPENIPPRTATARVILAMSKQRLGKPDEARSELARARTMIEDKFRTGLERGTPVQGFWFDWVFARILLDEATRLIPPPPSSLSR